MSAVHGGVADLPQPAVFFLGLDFEVRHRGLQLRVPVDEPLAAVDEPLLVELHEGLGHDLRESFVHREVGARPVDRVAEPAHLVQDRAAGVLLPVPHLLDERLAPHRAAIDAVGLELAFDDDLCGDPGVVSARQPQRVEARHAVIAGQRVHDRVVEPVPHVQQAGDVGRRQLDREGGPRWIKAGLEVAARFPYRRPACLDGAGFEALGQRRVRRRCDVVHCGTGSAPVCEIQEWKFTGASR